jgi:large repetitive protein
MNLPRRSRKQVHRLAAAMEPMEKRVLLSANLGSASGVLQYDLNQEQSTPAAFGGVHVGIGTAPSITSGASTIFTTGTTGTFSVTTTGNPTAAISETGTLPSGVTFVDNGNGTATLDGTPSASTGGIYDIVITANNGVAPNATQAFALTVDQPAGFATTSSESFQTGTTQTFIIISNGYPTPTVSEIGTLPTGITFTQGTHGFGILSGTPAAGTGGVYDITLTAHNGVGTDGTQSFVLSVLDAPAITSAAGTNFYAGQVSSFPITMTGYPDSMITETGALPSGVSFVDNGNDTAVLAGTPSGGSSGVYDLTITAGNGIGAGATQSFILTVGTAPAITSVDNATFVTGTSSSFTVTTTGSPNNSALYETGALPAGLTFTDNGNNTATIYGTPTADGVFNITLSGTNGFSPNASQAFTLTVDQAPAITSGNSATFTTSTTGSFTITTTGFPTSTLSELGNLPNGLTFLDNGNDTATIYGTPVAGTGGAYSLNLGANDGVGTAASQAFTLIVDQPPAITSANNDTFVIGTSGSFTVTTTGYPISALSETGALPAGLTFVDNSGNTATIYGTPDGSNGVFGLTLHATNGVGSPASQGFTLTVDQAPAIISANNYTYTAGSTGSFTVTTTGYPTSTLSETGSLPNGLMFLDNGNDTATIYGTPTMGSDGVYNLSLGATNGVGSDASQAFTLTVDQIPAITSAGAETFSAGASDLFVVTTTGFPAPAISETGALPAGVSLVDQGNGTAFLGGIPSMASGGIYDFTINATNTVGSATGQSFVLVVYAGASLPSTNSASFQVGSAGSFSVSANGYPTPFFTETGALPTGLTFVDNANGTATLLGTPATGQQGNYSITIDANNYIGPVAAQTLSLQVGLAPSIGSANNTTFTVGSAGSFNVTTTAFPTPSITENGALPAGVSFVDDANGTATLAGTPSAGTGGTYTFTIGASNGYTPNASQSFTLTVDQSPAITSSSSYTFTTGVTGSFTMTTTGYPFSTLSELGALPNGLTFLDNGNDTATLYGTPAAGTGNLYDLTLGATNGVGVAASQNFSLIVDQPPAITSAGNTTFTVGTLGSFTVTQTGYPAATISESGTLPNGVTFLDGALSGTPTAGDGGVYDITFTNDNGIAPAGTQSFVLTVDENPTITSAGSASFIVGTSSTFIFTSSGYPAPTISENGVLPTGVSFANGQITGTPGAGTGGIYDITITTDNTIAPAGTQSFVLTVDEAPTFNSAGNSTFTVGTPGSFSVTTVAFPTPSITETGALPAGVSFVDNADGTATLAGTPSASAGGTYTFTIGASNGYTPNASQSFTLTVDQAPAITSANNYTFTTGQTGSFTITTTGYPLSTLSEMGGLPSGITFVDNGDDTATLYGTPAGGTGNTYDLTLGATNGVGTAASQSFTLVIDQAAAFTSGANTTFVVGSAGTFTPTDTGYPAPTITESGTLPTGVTFVDGVLSGTPTTGDGGVYDINFYSNNGVAPAGTQSFVLTVNESVTFTSSSSTTFVTGSSYSFVVSTYGYPLPSLSEVGSLPTGITFTDNGNGSASIYGTAANGSENVYDFNVYGHNGIGADGTQAFVLTVDQAPAFTSGGAYTFMAGQTGSFTVTTTGLPLSALSEIGALPTGVSFTDNGNDTATITGTPGASTGGSYALTLTASNGVTPAGTQTFVITVDQAPAFTTAPTETFQVGSPLSYLIKTSGYPFANINESGTLPNGITFLTLGGGTAELTGTPIGGSGGIYDLTFTASNGIGSNAQQNFTLDVNQVPAFMSAASANFLAGSSNTYSVTIQGYPDVAITETGTLPPGVSFVDNGNGTATLAGTPTSGLGATYDLTLAATNIIGTGSQVFVLTVGQAPTITSGVSATFTVGSTGSFAVTSNGYPAATYSEIGTLPTGLTLNPTTGALSGDPAAGTGGNYGVTLMATNVFGAGTPQQFNFTVDQAPAITSAATATFTVGTTGSFTFTDTGFPAPTLNEIGALPNGVSFSNGTISGDPTAGTGDIYDITITSTNGVSPAGTQAFVLTVAEAPTITSGSAATFTVGATGSFHITASGFPASIITTNSTLPGGVTLVNGVLSGTPAAGTGGTYVIALTANDGITPNGTQSFTLTVDQAPAITSVAATTFTVGTTGSYTITDTGFPAVTVSTSSQLPTGVTLVNGVLSGDPAAGTGGTYVLALTASNGVAPAGTQSFTLTVDQAPAITNANNTTFTVGSTGSFTFTDTGFPAPTISTSSTLPSGVTLVNGVLSGDPAANTGGTYVLDVTASNGVTPAGTQSFTLTVDQAPAITSVAATTFTVGTSGSYTITDTGFPAVTVSTSSTLPTGVTLVNGVLSGDPAANTGGTYVLALTASNGVAPAGTQSFVLTVDQAPAITSANTATFTVGSTGSFTFTDTGFPAPTISTSSTLPSGVTLVNGVLSGDPAANTGETYSLTVIATNGVTPAGTQSFVLTVDQAPAITSASTATFTVGSTGSFTVTDTGFPAPVVTETGTLPAGVTFTNGVLSGDPHAATGGTYSFFLSASNGVGNTAAQAFTLTVDQAPAVTSVSTATFTVGSTGSFTVTDTGFPAPSVIETGTLPGGVTFSNGVLSGDPITGSGGLYTFSFSASNGIGSANTQSFTLTVDEAPSITSAGTATFIAGVSGSFTVVSRGFPAPTITESGTLPSGVTFSNGVLSGAAASGAFGAYGITFNASNGIGNTASQAFTLTENQNPSFTSANSDTVTAGSPATFTISTTAFPTATLVEQGTLPTGMSFVSNGNGTATLSGTPADTSGGGYSIQFIASNTTGASSTQSFALTVNTPPPVAVVTSTGTVAVTYPDGTLINTITPYTKGKAGSVAVMMVSGTPEIVVGSASGQKNNVEILSVSGSVQESFTPFTSTFTGGAFVATGDVGDNGVADIVVGQGAGPVAKVEIFDGNSFNMIGSFTPYAGYSHGVSVAAADVNDDGFADIITGQRGSARPLVKVFNGQQILAGTATLLSSFNPFAASYTGGVSLAAGLNTGGTPDIIVGKTSGVSEVSVFNGATDAQISTQQPFASSFTKGVVVSSADENGDGFGDIIIAQADEADPSVIIDSGENGSQLFAFTINSVSSKR